MKLKNQRRNKKTQRGTALIELAVALVITAVLSAGAAQLLVEQAEGIKAEAAGSQLRVLKGALDGYQITYYTQLATTAGAPVPIAGKYADALAPTLAELIADGQLNANFPQNTPYGQAIRVQLTRTNCPGALCRIDALAYSAAGITDLSGQSRTDLAGAVRRSAGGYGCASNQEADFGQLNCDLGMRPNPVGAVGGVVGVVSTLDATLFNQFVRMLDTRDPQLRGPLTVDGPVTANSTLATVGDLTAGANVNVAGTLQVAGATGLNTLQVNGASLFASGVTVAADGQFVDAGGNPCVVIGRTGSLTVQCNGSVQIANGQVVAQTLGGAVTEINSPTLGGAGVLTTGQVQATGGFIAPGGQAFGAANPNGVSSTGAQLDLRTAAGLSLRAEGGDAVAAKNLSASRLALRESVVIGSACTPTTTSPAGSGQELAAVATGGVATCVAGSWRGVMDSATSGAPCTSVGALATDPNTGAGLICRSGKWLQLDTVIGQYALGVPFPVYAGETMAESEISGNYADCQGGSLSLYVLPNSIGASIDGAYLFKIDTAGAAPARTITYQLTTGDGATLLPGRGGPGGDMATAIVMPYCRW